MTIENSAQVVEQKTEAIITTTTTNEQNGNGEVITTEQVENGKVEITEKIENGKNEENIKPEENKNEIDKPEQNGKTSSAPQRVRVPPGGFSSGFWWKNTWNYFFLRLYSFYLKCINNCHVKVIHWLNIRH